MIQLHRLEGFYWVARERGYARAARAFPYPISQPGVYQQVRKLEEELGAELFERVAKDEVTLTAAGQHLFGFCAPYFEQLPHVVRAIRSSSHGGVLRIDAAAMVLRLLLPSWLRCLRDARPDIQVDVEEIQTPDFDRLRTGGTDLIVDYVPSLPPGFDKKQIATSSVFLALAADHPLARRRRGRISLAGLRGEPFISYHPNLPQYAVQMEAVRRRLGVPERTLSAGTVDGILAFVRAGLGFSVVPWVGRRGPRVDGVVVERQPEAEFPIIAVWRETAWSNPLLDAALAAAPRL